MPSKYALGVVVSTGVFLLGCGGLVAAPAPTGPLVIAQAHGTSCGGWTGRVEVPSHPKDWKLQVFEGDGASPRTVLVRAGATEVPIAGSGGAPSVEVWVASVFAESDHQRVDIGPVNVGLSFTATHGPHPEGEVPALAVRVLADCPDLTELRVSADLQPAGRPLVVRAGLDAAGQVQIPLGSLEQGKHGIRVTALRGEQSLASRTGMVVVGPPCVDRDGDGVRACDGDCDDANPAIKPGAQEIIGDGRDNDCDGQNGRDRDRDGAEDLASGGTDCDDDNPYVYGGQLTPPDWDFDGHYAWTALDFDCDGVVDRPPTKGLLDCDDADPNIPRPELPDPNGVDDNCDGRVDEGTIAYDDDGDNQTELQGDCDDGDPRVYTGATELGDCMDNDCDGEIDEGVKRPREDDTYEPNDTEPYTLAGAVKMKDFIFKTGYKRTFERLALVSRDVSDVETFQVWTHDGTIDQWYVRVRAHQIGTGQVYDVEVSGNGHHKRGTLKKRSDELVIQGSPNLDDTGDYTITVRPREAARDWCPLVLAVSSG